MNIHDKSTQRGLAWAIGIILLIIIFVASKKSDDPPIKRPSLDSSAVSQPITQRPQKTGKVEITNAEPFFQGMDDLLPKIRKFDPSMGELSDMASDSLFYEAKDSHHNKLWVAGANNGIGELSWIWNHDGFQKPTGAALNNFAEVAKMMCGQEGGKWILSELKKPVTVEKRIRDTTYINHNELIFYNDAYSTINFTMKIQ